MAADLPFPNTQLGSTWVHRPQTQAFPGHRDRSRPGPDDPLGVRKQPPEPDELWSILMVNNH